MTDAEKAAFAGSDEREEYVRAWWRILQIEADCAKRGESMLLLDQAGRTIRRSEHIGSRLMAVVDQVVNMPEMRMSVGPGGSRIDEAYVNGWRQACSRMVSLLHDAVNLIP